MITYDDAINLMVLAAISFFGAGLGVWVGCWISYWLDN